MQKAATKARQVKELIRFFSHEKTSCMGSDNRHHKEVFTSLFSYWEN